jgi:hypothetical protein
LRSSWSKGLTKSYAYYLCQSKHCDSYGKSIPRDRLEGDVGEIIKTLQPTQSLVTLATAMFRHIWDAQNSRNILTVQGITGYARQGSLEWWRGGDLNQRAAKGRARRPGSVSATPMNERGSRRRVAAQRTRVSRAIRQADPVVTNERW